MMNRPKELMLPQGKGMKFEVSVSRSVPSCGRAIPTISELRLAEVRFGDRDEGKGFGEFPTGADGDGI